MPALSFWVFIIWNACHADCGIAAPDFASRQHRRLDLAEFNGWTLQKPAGSNLVSFSQELLQLADVRVGAPYDL